LKWEDKYKGENLDDGSYGEIVDLQEEGEI
jgi:hypothetical protein